MLYRIIAVLGLVFALSSVGYADRIEGPARGSTVSGIGIVYGWKCEAGTLTVRFDGGNPIEILYGSSRGDTLDVCGDSDNGYALLVNYNLLGEGQHTAVVYDDEVEFDRVNFMVVTPGVEFLQGVSGTGTVTLSNGQEARVEWSESTQGFVATQFTSPPMRGGLCTTKTARVLDYGSSGDPATWAVTNPCDGETLDIDITPLTSDGFFACSGDLEFVQGGVQFDGSHYDWFDKNTLDSVCDRVLFGLTKQTTVELETTSLNFSQPFKMYQGGQLIFEFP